MTGTADLDLLACMQAPQTLADVGGCAPDLAIEAARRWDVEIRLIDLDRKGEFPDRPSDWLAPYRARLAEAGIDPGRIAVIRDAASLRPSDVVLALRGFGDRHKIRHIPRLLDRALHAESRLFLDIRKGSGSFPFLKDYGTSDVLGRAIGADGVEVTRVLFTPLPKPEGNPDEWAAIARDLAGPEGFFTDNGRHSFLYIPRGRTLVVTFDNLDIAMDKREDRRPWGFGFIEKQGWSMLGVMAAGWTWYRDPWVGDEFDRLAAEGFFAQFDRVVFYGASMGGYAAAAYSGACPGADVVAISPQSTVDKTVVPWETRYRTVWGADFSGRYGDAALVSGAARQVTILFDPYEPLDAAHAARFSMPNVRKLRAPLLGHRLGSSLSQMGVLTPIILGALDGSLTGAGFYRVLRARKGFARYQRELFEKAVARGHLRLARRLADWVLARGDNRFIRERAAALPR